MRIPLEKKVITVNERGLTSADWVVYNKGTKITFYRSVPTSNITAEVSLYKFIAVNNFYIVFISCLLMLNFIPAVGATEKNREEIINKVTKSLNGEGKIIGPVMDYRITEYDSNSNVVTILVFRGEAYDVAELESETLPIVFLDTRNEKVIINHARRGKLDRLSIIGYIDEQYACVVCFTVRVNNLCE